MKWVEGVNGLKRGGGYPCVDVLGGALKTSTLETGRPGGESPIA